MEFYLPTALLSEGQFRHGPGLLVQNGRIAALCSEAEAPAQASVERLDGWLAPGYVDLQINGCGGVIFTQNPSFRTIERMSEVLGRHGVTSFLPTLITAPTEAIERGIAAVREARARLPSVFGMHLEGPHLSLARPGTHDKALIRPMTDADQERILGAADVVRLLTVAGESVADGQIEALARAGISLALGHTAMSATEVLAAERNGARMLTHLFNAMPPLAGREPGPIGAAFSSGTLAASIIVDRVHVDEVSVRAAARALGDRLVLISDATASLEGGTEPFEFGGYTCRIEGGAVRNDAGALAGAAILLDEVVQHMAAISGDRAQAVRMASELPARLIGAEGEIGRLAPGLRADFVLLDPADLRVGRVWAQGRPVPG